MIQYRYNLLLKYIWIIWLIQSQTYSRNNMRPPPFSREIKLGPDAIWHFDDRTYYVSSCKLKESVLRVLNKFLKNN